MGRDNCPWLSGRHRVVSIHAPAWGATENCPRQGDSARRSFNPRARMGRDSPTAEPNTPDCRFQSTRPHGARLIESNHIAELIQFQSTRPHGARPGRRTAIRNRHGFNPRARMGRDSGISGGAAAPPVSIHAPAWGATPTFFATKTRILAFQSTRPHGARQQDDAVRRGVSSFNPRARMGRDQSRSRRST